jgi:membrane protease YdiL (CAAX protease family)
VWKRVGDGPDGRRWGRAMSEHADDFAARRERVAASWPFAALEGVIRLLEGVSVAVAAHFFSSLCLWETPRSLLATGLLALWFRVRILPTVGGMCSFAPTFVPSGRVALLVAGLALVGVYNRAELSFANVWRNERFDWEAAVRLVVASPLQEELLFRGTLFLPMVGGKRQRALPAALLSGALFALGHAGNTSLSFRYRLAQMCFAAVCGTCYALHLRRERSFVQTFLAHAVNNALAAVTPVALLERSFLDAAVGPPLVAVLLLHAALLP